MKVPADFVTVRRTTVRIRDIPLALLSPKRVFSRVEDVAAYGWPLIILLVSVTLIGFAVMETGLVDREVDRQVQRSIAELEKKELDVVERSTLSTMIKDVKKAGEFQHLMVQVGVIAVQPLTVLASVLLLGSVFYAAVALTGKKPEWHTLLTVFVFASFADVIGLIVRLAFMLRFRTLEVETSLAPLAKWMTLSGDNAALSQAVISGLLTAFDPFRIWFWLVAIVGLSTTAQLSGWKVWTLCVLLWGSAAGLRAAAMAAAVSGPIAV